MGLQPDAVAVDGLSYREVGARSDRLARVLAETGVRTGDRVGVCLERGPDLVVALLAVLKAGAAYVPLDPHYPRERLEFIASDTGLQVALAETDPQGPCTELGLKVVTMDAAPHQPERELPAIDADQAAYVIHTSGSTGRPKGVVVTHRNVGALIDATRGEFNLGPHDVWTLFHSFAFDFSVWEIFGCLLTGGRLIVVPYWTARDPEEFHTLLTREAVTVLNQTPTAFSQLLTAQAFTRTDLAVRLLIFGGESLDTALLLPWFDRYPATRCRPVNMYGITETTVHCTWRTLTRHDALHPTRSVGRPLPGWHLHVLDEHGHPTPTGVPGEIHISGAGVTRGYHNRPELTTQRFLPHTTHHTRLYRTGDRGRFLTNGELEHLGRLDDQVKIRGHRIELGEIRTVLLEDPDIHAAAVVVHHPNTPTARLDAYIVTTHPHTNTHHITQRLTQRLPHHLQPATLTT
ncbi:amino acid adenylation domain-containing protein, partial [Streptomyces chattanoogensis]|uniref:amino acid adenylation domain-containing protein n=1 Tax=Streptomyces chattanoogensis TaxID=66876 RepID=UPI001FE14BAE